MAKAINQDIQHYMQGDIKNLPEENDDGGEENDDQEIDSETDVEVADNEDEMEVTDNEDGMIVAEDQAQEIGNSQDMNGLAENEEEAAMVIDDTAQPNETDVEDEEEQNVDLQQDYREEFGDAYEESEDEQYIPAHTEISLFQKYLQHPLFNDD